MSDPLYIPNGPRVSERMLAEFLRIVPRGIDHAITADKLCWRLGICERGRVPDDNHKRIIRALRQASRETGTVVIGSNDGYYVPLNMSEVDAGHKRRRQMAMTALEDLRAEREAAALMLAAMQTEGEQMGIVQPSPATPAQPDRLEPTTHPRTTATPGTLAAIREAYGEVEPPPYTPTPEPQPVRRAPPPRIHSA